MDDDVTPPTQSSGSLVPPTKVPGTALATATPPPPSGPLMLRTPSRMTIAQFFANLVLDSVDEVADAVAGTLGLRR